jgi:hypothetical protein
MMSPRNKTRPSRRGSPADSQVVDRRTTVTAVSMISIALGLQTGLLRWRGGRQLVGEAGTG